MISDLINGRDMLLRMHEELCDGIRCDNCTMCTEDGGCRVEEWIDKFPSAIEAKPVKYYDTDENVWTTGNVIVSSRGESDVRN